MNEIENQYDNYKVENSRGNLFLLNFLESQNEINSKDDDDEKRKGKRRSKNDNDGRTHKCPQCGKSYLSYPALYTHIKQKHNQNGHSGRGRGRPKKDTGETNPEKLKYNPLDTTFFSHEDRKGQTVYLEGAMEEVFNYIYGDSKANRERSLSKKITFYENSSRHPFFQKINEFKNNPNRQQLDGESSRSDEVFADYVLKMANYCNPTYFPKVLKFVTLFRECANILNKEKVKNEMRDFTEIFHAEDIPDISNEFITEFLDPDQNVFDINKEEAIDLTQNFCHWLYENNFTCSKLSLISNSY